jgi:hypothetical protein
MEPSISLKALQGILREAIKAVPAVRYALGVAGISAAAAIAYAIFQQKAEAAIIGTAIMMAFMIVLLVFAALSRIRISIIQYPAILLLWITIICFCATIVLLTSSFFFQWPINFDGQKQKAAFSQIPILNFDDPLGKVKTSNLPVTDEITSLLSQTKPKTLLRIAVPTIAVDPPEKINQAHADALKEFIVRQLNARSVVVSEAEIGTLNNRIAEKGIDRISDQEISEAGRSVAADLVLKSKIFQIGGSRYTVSISPILVSEQRPLTSIVLDRNAVDISSANEAATKLAELIMQSARGVVTTDVVATNEIKDTLSFAQRNQLARARAYLREGKLIEAQPLYAAALGEESNEWQSEIDYATLMTSLGMAKWVEARTSEALKRLPTNSWCDRAGLLIQKARATSISSAQTKKPFADARESITAAATCGDTATIALALHQYAYFALDTNVALAREANNRARSILDKNKIGYEWLRCQIDFFDEFVQQTELRQYTDASSHYAQIAEQCEKAGNLRAAAISFRNASNQAWHSDQKDKLLKRAIEIAEKVGGVVLDDCLLQDVDNLLTSGRRSDADSQIIKVIQYRVSELVALHGNLPVPLEKLDSELLGRLHLEIGVPKELTANGELLSQTHFHALSKALRAWAKRTKIDSWKLAESYEQIADQIEGIDTSRVRKNEQDLIEQRLADAGASYGALIRWKNAPLRSEGVNLNVVRSALWSLFFEVHGKKDTSSDWLDEIVNVAMRVARWRDSQRDEVESLRMSATLSLDRKRTNEALEKIGEAKDLAKNDPWLLNVILSLEANAVKHTDRRRYLQTLDLIVRAAERVSPNDWVIASYNAAFEKWSANELSAEEGGSQLEALAENLASQNAWDSADTAYVKAAQFYDQTQHQVGSSQAIKAYVHRFDLQQARDASTGTRDTLRSLGITIDLIDAVASYYEENYRGGVMSAFRTNENMKRLLSFAAKSLKQLAAEHKLIDATRMVGKLPYFGEGVEDLVEAGLQWSEGFKDSSEYPSIVGQLYRMRGTIRKESDTVGYMDDLIKARDLFALAKLSSLVSQTQSTLIRYAFPDETEVWKFVDECLSMFRDDANLRTDCHQGFATGLFDHPIVINESARAKSLLADGLRCLSDELDAAWPPLVRFDYRAALSWIAIAVGDRGSFDKLDGDIRQYYSVGKPVPYQLVTYLSRTEIVAKEFDLKLALKLSLEFEKTPGASDGWRAQEYIHYAELAHKGGDTASEERLLKEGKEFAERWGLWVAYQYDLYGLWDDLSSQNWKNAERRLSNAILTLEKRPLKPELRINDLKLHLATLQALDGDLAAADRELTRQVEWGSRGLDEKGKNEIPCFSARILEISSAVKSSMNMCGGAQSLHDTAAKVRLKCSARKCYGDGDDRWCDAPTDDLRLTATCGKPLPGELADSILQYWK